MVIIDHLAALAALAVITGVPSYFFHPQTLPVERQNRAIALSYYSAASLSVSPLGVVAAWLLNGIYGGWTLLTAIVAFTAVQYLLYWRSLLVLTIRGLALRNPARTVIVAGLIPILQAIAGATVYMLVSYSLKFLALLWLALFPS